MDPVHIEETATGRFSVTDYRDSVPGFCDKCGVEESTSKGPLYANFRVTCDECGFSSWASLAGVRRCLDCAKSSARNLKNRHNATFPCPKTKWYDITCVHGEGTTHYYCDHIGSSDKTQHD